MGKKILSLVCALCLVASMFTIGIFAASAEETGETPTETVTPVLNDWSKWKVSTKRAYQSPAHFGVLNETDNGINAFYIKCGNSDATTKLVYGDKIDFGNKFDYNFKLLLRDYWPKSDWHVGDTPSLIVPAFKIGDLELKFVGIDEEAKTFGCHISYKGKELFDGSKELVFVKDEALVKKIQDGLTSLGKGVASGIGNYGGRPYNISVKFDNGKLTVIDNNNTKDSTYATVDIAGYSFKGAEASIVPFTGADNSNIAVTDISANVYTTPNPEKPTEKGVKLEAKTDLVLDTDTFEGNTDDIQEVNGKKYFYRQDINTTTINTKTAYDLGTGFEVTAKLAFVNWAKENDTGEHASIFFNEPGKGLELRIYSYCSNKKNKDGSYHSADDCNKKNDGHHVAGMEYKYDIAVCVDGVAVANYTSSSPNGTYTLRYLDGKVSVLFNGAALKLTLASDKTEAKTVSVDGLDFSNTKIGLLMMGNWCRDADSRSWYDISVAPTDGEDEKGVKLDSKVQLPFNEDTFTGAINGFKEGGYFYSTVNLINVDTLTRYDLGTKFALEANLVFANGYPNYYGEHASMYVGTMGEGLELRVYAYCAADHNEDECNVKTDGHHSLLKVGTYDVCLYYKGQLIGNLEGDCNEAPNGTYTLKYNEGKVSVDLNGETLNIKTPGGGTAKTVDIADADFSNTTVGLAIMGNWHADPAKRNWNTFSIAPLSGNGSVINSGSNGAKTGDTRNIALAIAIMLGSASAAGLILLNKKQLAK